MASSSVVWMNSGVLIYAAQSIGLHREPSKIGLSGTECELRRRMWVAILVYENTTAWYNGMRSQIHPGDYDCIHPAYLPELDGADENSRFRTLWSVQMSKMLLYFNEIYREAYCTKRTCVYRAGALDRQIQELELKTYEMLSADFESGTIESQFRELAFEVLLCRLYLCVQIPFLRKMNKFSCKRTLEVAQRSIRSLIKFNDCALETISYRWYGQIWILTSPLLATIVMSIALVKLDKDNENLWSLVGHAYEILSTAPEFQVLKGAEMACWVIKTINNERNCRGEIINNLDTFCGIEPMTKTLLQMFRKDELFM
ncbi:putative transcriptional regulatory protein [Neolecta irregularis DAH-3]|uniref:Putative transcriptional regulatory protein n=1 Tax=Neolecta irregularis (strain DAH-3) TaxID=1198029 RepID=A0A1U7LGD9_NEOID|nr:putative transcriptional regulatory protein [Neolecta irregularis DAH-3]|eukprot:OLL21688.1 putative transcriptional regulatory protein [Neolecta irregularis DAH-3]